MKKEIEMTLSVAYDCLLERRTERVVTTEEVINQNDKVRLFGTGRPVALASCP